MKARNMVLNMISHYSYVFEVVDMSSGKVDRQPEISQLVSHLISHPVL